MLENIEKLIRCCGELHIEEERYGDDILACIDILICVNNASDEQDGTVCYQGNELYDAVDAATSPGDTDAMNALEKLETFASEHPEFLYARGKTLEQVLENLENRAFLWNKIKEKEGGRSVTSKSQTKMLLDFVKHECNVC